MVGVPAYLGYNNRAGTIGEQQPLQAPVLEYVHMQYQCSTNAIYLTAAAALIYLHRASNVTI